MVRWSHGVHPSVSVSNYAYVFPRCPSTRIELGIGTKIEIWYTLCPWGTLIWYWFWVQKVKRSKSHGSKMSWVLVSRTAPDLRSLLLWCNCLTARIYLIHYVHWIVMCYKRPLSRCFMRHNYKLINYFHPVVHFLYLMQNDPCIRA